MTERQINRAHQGLLKKARKDGSWNEVFKSASTLPARQRSAREAQQIGIDIPADRVRVPGRRL